VLNAADPMSRAWPVCPGQVIFFAPTAPPGAGHPPRPGQAHVCSSNSGDDRASSPPKAAWRERMPLADMPLTRGGRIGFQVENAMAAVAAAWAARAGLGPHRAQRAGELRQRRRTAPGRFNVFDYRGATLIADYGHNPDAMRALVQAVEAMPAVPGQRRSVVISGAGDRRDEDIREQTQILGEAFDEVVLYQDAASAAAPTAR
jgi:cyanophycin synthetase